MTATPFLCEDALRAALGARADRMSLRLFDTVDSTNTAAKATAATDTLPALLIARTQTRGRGRLGRQFHSPADTGLYMTVAYTTARPLTEAVRVTAGAAVAAVAAIEQTTDKRPAIKWVNDIYLNGAKLGGILTEAVTLPEGGGTRMVVGLGINLTTADFPADLRAPAAALFAPSETARADATFMGTLAGEIARRLLELAEATPDGAFHGGLWGRDCLDFYRRHALYLGETVRCTRGNECFEGTVTGIGEDYSLLLSVDGRPMALSSGEVSVRPL